MKPDGENEIVLTARHLKKTFGQVQALTDGNITLRRGEIMALVGDNGAGKSTLIKCLSGVLTPDGGTIALACHPGAAFHSLTISQAKTLGISVVYQDLALVDVLDVVSNIWLGSEAHRMGIFLDRKKMERDAEELLQRLSIKLPPLDMPAGKLSGGQRQSIAVVRAIAQGGSVLIMDEPSAAMGLRESNHLLEIMQNLKAQELAILWISHNLPQILQAADRVTVMRGGKTVREAPAQGLDPLVLSGWMSGALS